MRTLSHFLSKLYIPIQVLILTAPRERNDDGKSLKNPQHGVLSKAYEEFPDPLAKDRRGGFDIHIYHYQVRLYPVVYLGRLIALTNYRITPTKPPTQRHFGKESDVNVSNAYPKPVPIEPPLMPANSPRTPHLQILRWASRPSPRRHVRSQPIHPDSIWCFRSMAGYQSGTAECLNSPQHGWVWGRAKSYTAGCMVRG